MSSGTQEQCSFENTSLPLTKGAANVWHYLADPGLVAKCRKNLYLCISAFSLRLPHVLLHVAKKLLLRTQDATWTTYSVPPQALTHGKCIQICDWNVPAKGIGMQFISKWLRGCLPNLTAPADEQFIWEEIDGIRLCTMYINVRYKTIICVYTYTYWIILMSNVYKHVPVLSCVKILRYLQIFITPRSRPNPSSGRELKVLHGLCQELNRISRRNLSSRMDKNTINTDKIG